MKYKLIKHSNQKADNYRKKKTQETNKQRLLAGPVFKKTIGLRLKDYFIANNEQKERSELTLEDLEITEDGYWKEPLWLIEGILNQDSIVVINLPGQK